MTKILSYQYVPIVGRKVMRLTIYAINVRRQPIATPLAKRNIDINIRKSVRNISD